MAAPDYVPTDPVQRVRSYASPPRRASSWRADRAGDLPGAQPSGARLGNQGPDQGYALRLVHQFADRLHLGDVDQADAEAACVAVALKRAASYGRAPVVHDLTAAFTVFGFLDPEPHAELVAYRERVFAEVHSSHHYTERRQIVDAVPESALRRSIKAITLRYESDWRSNLDL